MTFSKASYFGRRIGQGNSAEKGMTLVETVVAIVIFTTMVASFLPLFMAYKATTIRNDIRLGAVAVTQQVMDELRRIEPCHIPTTGIDVESYPSSISGCQGPAGTGASTSALVYKGKTYRVSMTYCDPSTDCVGDARRIRVRTHHNSSNDPLFQIETVYTKLTPPES
jgi:type II secretory pathway pseudopilin PulG